MYYSTEPSSIKPIDQNPETRSPYTGDKLCDLALFQSMKINSLGPIESIRYRAANQIIIQSNKRIKQ